MRTTRIYPILVAALFLSIVSAPVHSTSSYTPRQGDYFTYHETIDLNNGQNYYSGYTEHQDIIGIERVNRVYSNNGTVAAHYGYNWTFTPSSGSGSSGRS